MIGECQQLKMSVEKLWETWEIRELGEELLLLTPPSHSAITNPRLPIGAMASTAKADVDVNLCDVIVIVPQLMKSYFHQALQRA
jgi:hypothetical protein